MHRIVLACLIMFQSVPVRADVTHSVSTIINQLKESYLSNNLFESKASIGCCAAFIAAIVAYAGYCLYVNKLVGEVEDALQLKDIKVSCSYGALGPDLYLRLEAIYKVLYVTENPDHQPERVRKLLQNQIVKTGLIRKQEELLTKELKNAESIWQLDDYADIARKRLGLIPLTQRYGCIGSDSDNPQKKEAYDKLGTKERNEVAFEVFSRNLYGDTASLNYWQENSILFKKPLKQILDAAEKK